MRGKDDDALSSYISKSREMRSAFNALVQWRYVPDPGEQEQRQNEVGAGKEELEKAKEGLAKAIKERDEARIALVALQQQDNSDASASADAQQQRDSEATRELDRLLGSLREGSEAGLFAAGMRPGASSSKGEMQTRNLGMVERRRRVGGGFRRGDEGGYIRPFESARFTLSISLSSTPRII